MLPDISVPVLRGDSVVLAAAIDEERRWFRRLLP